MFERTLTRREALRSAVFGAAGLTLLDLGFVRVHAAPASATAAIRQAKAKSVIQIWMWGGPSHLDTFDPKPGAGYDYCGPLNKAIPTNVDGIQIGELLPSLAKQADKYSVVRSMTHGVNSHETASYRVQTGHMPDRFVYPTVGAVVSKFKGYDHGYSGMIPPYVILTELQGRFSEEGLLGPRYKPFATGGDPNRTPFAVEGIVADGISLQRQQSRRELLHALDTLGKAIPENRQFLLFDACEERAYDLILGDARKLFDLSDEPEGLRELYGRNTFGQSCLMARRLVERGVPYVTINYKGWDTHKRHFETMRRKLPEMDKGMAALLQDISDRGLLDSTIVWWTGEFGRTPRVQWEAPWNGGRGHFGACFNSVVAGGGFKGGHVVGASNDTGEEVTDRPVAPEDLIGSVYELMGIDAEQPLANVRGVTVPVLPDSQAGGHGAGRLHEIM
ncbi:MAG: DUF1501 domain-containing protein [Candidatus Hydrogenedentes bacterium]|nr:DUF1501 domain-containing protein [Candidatus Hydrogenedentota bacterium]